MKNVLFIKNIKKKKKKDFVGIYVAFFFFYIQDKISTLT